MSNFTARFWTWWSHSQWAWMNWLTNVTFDKEMNFMTFCFLPPFTFYLSLFPVGGTRGIGGVLALFINLLWINVESMHSNFCLFWVIKSRRESIFPFVPKKVKNIKSSCLNTFCTVVLSPLGCPLCRGLFLKQNQNKGGYSHLPGCCIQETFPDEEHIPFCGKVMWNTLLILGLNYACVMFNGSIQLSN